MRDVDSALVAAHYFESVHHMQEGSKVMPWAGALSNGSDYTCGCQVCIWGALLLYTSLESLIAVARYQR